jgi:hypothetical protein
MATEGVSWAKAAIAETDIRTTVGERRKRKGFRGKRCDALLIGLMDGSSRSGHFMGVMAE